MIDEKKLIEDIIPVLKTLNADDAREVMEVIKSQYKVGEWILCSERLPEEKINPVTHDFYEYPVTADFRGVKDVRYYKFGKGHWWHGAGVVDHLVIAWMPLPEPYREEKDRKWED